MNKKDFLKAALWSAVMIAIQVIVDVVRHTEINWVEVLIGGGIVFLICIGSKKNPTIEKKNPQKTNKVSCIVDHNISPDTDTVKINSTGNKSDADMNDLRFYAYNRIAVFSLVIGVGCVIYGRMAQEGNVFWLYLAGVICMVQSAVFFALYTKKRDEFVKKEREHRTGKKTEMNDTKNI